MEHGWQHRRACTEEYLLHQRQDLVLKIYFLFNLVNHPVLWFKCGWQRGEGGRERSEGWQLQMGEMVEEPPWWVKTST